ncbi:ClpX C4-type zinc finger protein [Patescibacteria group bacterium]
MSIYSNQYCSFCNKNGDQVKHIFTDLLELGFFICDECTERLNQSFDHNRPDQTTTEHACHFCDPHQDRSTTFPIHLDPNGTNICKDCLKTYRSMVASFQRK